MRQWPMFSALLVLLLVFAACEGESPTEPSRGGGTGGGGTTTPPTDPSIALTVSNPTPLVGSTSVITATVTQNSQPVPNGTAVEYSTNLGSFQDTNTNSTVRTTTGGVASATLSSNAAGAATVTVRVANKTALATVTFSQTPIEQPPVETAPAITSISPATGKPAGGDLVTITGRNFEPPLRVLFGETQAQVVSSTSTQISVISPAINLGAGEQFKEVTITVITRAGTSGEARATGGPFRYQLDILTPTVYHVSPSSGSNDGNTRVTVFGDGFQSPAKVFFGGIEANVEQVNFNQIIALTPPATGMGAALANKEVDVRVLNLASNKSTTLPAGFRYGPAIRITAVGPTIGSAFESTKVTIEGWGFDDQKVAVTIGGIAAQPIFVSGTKIIAQTGLPVVNSCGDISGPVSVTNIEDGTSATADGISFTFRVPTPAITSVTPNPAAPGSTVTVAVAGAGPGPARFRIGDVTVAVSGTPVYSGLDATYQVVLPSTFEFNTRTCVTTLGVEGEQFVETAFDVEFENILSGCADTFTKGLLVTPPDTTCRTTPAVATATPAAVTFTNVTAGTTSNPSFVTVGNTGGQAMTVNAVVEMTDPESRFAIVSDTCTGQVINPNGACTFGITYSPTTAGESAKTASFQVQTTVNDPLVSATGSAAP